MKHHRKFLIGMAFVALFQTGCGGGGIDGEVNGPPPSTLPTINANVYRGVADPGELVELTLDPAAKSYSLVVTSSQFGVSSTPITGNYREESGRFIDTVDSSISFIVSNGQAFGNFKVTTGTGTPLNLAMMATNQGTESVADLAGVYGFVTKTARVDGSEAQAESGQMKIGNDGSIRICEAQAYSDTCKSLDGLDVLAQVVHAGGGRWNIKVNGIKMADFYPRRIGGVTSFLIDYTFTDDTGPRVGSGVMASSRNLDTGNFDGTYNCFGQGSVLDLTIKGANASDNFGNTFFLTYNSGGSLVNDAWKVFNTGALVSVEMPGRIAPNGRFVLLPLSEKELIGTGINGTGTVITMACVRP